MSIVEAWTTRSRKILKLAQEEQEQARLFRLRAQAFGDEFGRQVMVANAAGAHRVTGLSLEVGEEVPENWRSPRGQQIIVPRQNTKAGKELNSRMSELRYEKKKIPGMPSNWLADDSMRSYFVTPTYNIIGGRVFVAFSVKTPDAVKADFDITTWREMKLSQFFAVCEKEGVQF